MLVFPRLVLNNLIYDIFSVSPLSPVGHQRQSEAREHEGLAIAQRNLYQLMIYNFFMYYNKTQSIQKTQDC